VKNLVFCDCETSGLNEGKDVILEIALVAVKLPTFEEVAAVASPVLPPQWPTVKRNMHEKVLAMHTESGLVAVLDQLYQQSTAPNAEVVEMALRGWMNEWSPATLEFRTPLAGANPDFDRRFLVRHMPELLKKFHYRNYDVRSITQLQEWVFGIPHTDSPHRALPDARKAIKDVREFLGLA
jgi:oligoribonuclease